MKLEKRVVLPNFLFILCLVYLILQLYRQNNATYMKGLYLLVLALALGQIHVTLAKRKLTVEIKETKLGNISKKEGTKLTLCLINHSFLQSPYIHIFLKPSYHATSKVFTQLCVTLPPHAHKEIELDYEGCYAGYEQLEIEKIILQDYFQIATRRVKQNLKASIAVLPEVTKLSRFNYLFRNMQAQKEGSQTTSIISQEGDINSELKPYIQGDSLKLVHWKLAARKDIYMVRQREEQIGVKQSCVMVLDPICKELDENKRAQLIDKTLVACISCIYEFLREERKVCLVYLKENTWDRLELTSVSQLELAAQAIGKGIMTQDQQLNGLERWPKAYLKHINKEKSSKLLITSALTTQLVNDIEEEKGLNVLEMEQGFLGREIYGQSWYLSSQYEVMRYV